MTEEEFLAIWANSIPTPQPIFYRVYYDDNGIPLFYSMEDLPGKYIELDHATYADPPKYAKVVDGQLIRLKTNTVLKLHPRLDGPGTPCHPKNVSIVVDPKEPNTKWILK